MLKSSRVQCEEEKGKAAEEIERLQQAIKLQAMKTGHIEDQMEELKTTQRVSLKLNTTPGGCIVVVVVVVV